MPPKPPTAATTTTTVKPAVFAVPVKSVATSVKPASLGPKPAVASSTVTKPSTSASATAKTTSASTPATKTASTSSPVKSSNATPTKTTSTTASKTSATNSKASVTSPAKVASPIKAGDATSVKGSLPKAQVPAAPAPVAPAGPRIKCLVRQIADILFDDSTGAIASESKWPLVADKSGQVATFMRYRDVNYLNVCNPGDTTPERIRLALIGAARYEKPFVVDMMESDMWNLLPAIFNKVRENLFEDIVSRRILEPARIVTLVRESDGPDYHKENFAESRMAKLKIIFITTNEAPSAAIIADTFQIEVSNAVQKKVVADDDDD